MYKKSCAVVVGLMCCALSAKADIAGSTVTGSLNFNGGSTNFFNPMYGYVPAGYGNSSAGTSVVIGPGTEFGFNDGYNLDTANFTGKELRVTDSCQIASCASNYGVTYSFNDAAFSGLAINFLSNGLGLTASLMGSVLTLSQKPGVPTNGTVASVLSFTAPAATPEPGSLALLGTGLLGIAGLARRRFARAVA